MPAIESEAIIFRSFPLGEGDLLVSFFSRTLGPLRGVASRARKPKSPFGAGLEPLSHIRIWFYERETRELVRITQCELIESFLDVQRDYTAGLALGLASETTEAIVGAREAADANFRLLLLTARAIKSQTPTTLALAYFALWTVRLGGWLPQLDRCGNCGAELAGSTYLSQTSGLVCGACRAPGQRAFSQSALRLARRIATEKLEQLAPMPERRDELKEIMNFMLDIIEQHIGKPLRTRRLLEAATEPFV
jgi:DNA repair protein RecO (recombination protein O)